ncbi:HD domain-containing protein [Paenibacillus sp. J2TS4]|uniref:HD domain-containing protein n=1 Tax=Paenibacillus sp. J2TS4 TaxID=2807194 RepID=UPI001B1A5909|nr:HD domain-containing protein [Paenibacillus sp. J2TS4]GIP31780.1 phosphohydrolase [Paenibacillus sp. J2TS4]
MKTKEVILKSAEQFVKQELDSDRSGHDWWHIQRVRRLAVELARVENANLFVCELSALLHDVADEKLNESKEAGLLKVQHWLAEQKIDKRTIGEIMTIISTMSFNGGSNPSMETIEGKVVQDADRLDALGAIGIARTFIYTGWKGQLLHDPERDFRHLDYRSEEKTAIYHFYEKLLKIKALLNTEYAKQIAENRHQFMEIFLEQFYNEWELRDNMEE